MIDDLVTIGVVHFIWVHFSHHLFLVIICCPHIVGLSIEWTTCSVLVRVIHLICIVKVSAVVNDIDVIVVEHLSIVVVVISMTIMALLPVLLPTGLSRCTTLSSLHVHEVVLDISVKLNVKLAADIANYSPNFVEVLSFIDIAILKVVKELLLIVVGCTVVIFLSTEAKYFSILFLIIWRVSLVLIILQIEFLVELLYLCIFAAVSILFGVYSRLLGPLRLPLLCFESLQS